MRPFKTASEKRPFFLYFIDFYKNSCNNDKKFYKWLKLNVKY